MKIDFQCKDHPGLETQAAFDTIDDLLGSMIESGWPICAECGEDLQYEIDDNPMIRITMEGGLIQDVERNKAASGVAVKVWDFDVEGADPEFDDIRKNDVGDEYCYSER